MTKIAAGEVWKVIHCRKGPLTLRFNQDCSRDDEWIDGEIIEGRARYASGDNNFLQKNYGLGTRGDTITSRGTFLAFVEQVAPPSNSGSAGE